MKKLEEINQSFKLTKSFLRESKTVLLDGLLLEAVPVSKPNRISHKAIQSVFSFIAKRTLRFYQPMEYISRNEISKGISNLTLPGTGLSVRTIQHALNVLFQNGLLLKFADEEKGMLAWGLNLERIFGLLLESDLLFSDRPRSYKANLRKRVETLYSQIKRKKGLFSRFSCEGVVTYTPDQKSGSDASKRALNDGSRVIRFPLTQGSDMEAASDPKSEKKGLFSRFSCEGVVTYTPDKKSGSDASKRALNDELKIGEGSSMALLKETISDANSNIWAARKSRIAKKALGSFSSPGNGATAALSFWHRCVLDTEKYPHYVVSYTTVELSMMKHFLRQCEEDGMTEDEVREKIRFIVDSWEELSARAFNYFGVTKSGTGYQKQVYLDKTPYFRVFFTYRLNVEEMLAAKKPEEDSIFMFR